MLFKLLSLIVFIKLGQCEIYPSFGGASSEPHRIAIIGGGIGGASAAHFLQELSAGKLLVDVYESGRIGGRLATTSFAGHYYEVGGSILHPKNKYMKRFVENLGLSAGESCPSSFGLFDGSEFVFRDSSYQAVTLAKLLWRYGLSLYGLKTCNDELLRRFDHIYDIQDHGLAFKNLSSLLYALHPSFSSMLDESTRDHLIKEMKISSKVVDELVTAATLANYGQTPDINAFVGAVGVAAASPNLWSVKGGNKQVPEYLLAKSRASVLHRHVTQISRVEMQQPATGSSLFEITSVEPQGDNGLLSEGGRENHPTDEVDARTQEYDAVIIATPLTSDKTNIKFVNMTRPSNFQFDGKYERIVATLVHGTLRSESFQVPKEEILDDVLVTNPKLMYNAIGRNFPIDVEDCQEAPSVFKVFSPKPLTEGSLTYLFSEIKANTSFDWLAYPHYTKTQDYPANFELEEGVYYANAIELASSAMEMAVIGARNTALLTMKYLTGNSKFGNLRLRQKEEL